MLPIRPAVVGLPFDAASSHQRGAAGAPAAIRQALGSPSGNAWAERGLEVASETGYEDLGDLDLTDVHAAPDVIAAAIADLACARRPFLAIGGDHSISHAVLRGVAEARLDRLTVLHVDAHPDLYDQFDGRRDSHACPFARVMEAGLATSLVQVGIRASTGHQRDQAARFGVEQIDMRAWADGARPVVAGDVYLSIDLDALDPAFAPGVSHPEPGGLSTRELIGLVQAIDARLVGVDLVEYNPARDIHGLTAVVAAKLVKEVLAKLQVDA